MVWSKTYNEVALLFKGEICDVRRGMPDYEGEQKRMIAAIINGIRIINVYCVNREATDSPKFLYKQALFFALHQFVSSKMHQYEKVVVLRDFNIASADVDVYDANK